MEILSILVESPEGLTSDAITEQIKKKSKIPNKKYIPQLLKNLKKMGLISKGKGSFKITTRGITQIDGNLHLPPE
ncbi:MAG: hypothetical protein HWN66_05170 [Candidatus Helarchaeota archaeon]|nr:hypothetical protein [Candidatus Helarchaeota archaeon]